MVGIQIDAAPGTFADVKPNEYLTGYPVENLIGLNGAGSKVEAGTKAPEIKTVSPEVNARYAFFKDALQDWESMVDKLQVEGVADAKTWDEALVQQQGLRFDAAKKLDDVYAEQLHAIESTVGLSAKASEQAKKGLKDAKIQRLKELNVRYRKDVLGKINSQWKDRFGQGSKDAVPMASAIHETYDANRAYILENRGALSAFEEKAKELKLDGSLSGDVDAYKKKLAHAFDSYKATQDDVYNHFKEKREQINEAYLLEPPVESQNKNSEDAQIEIDYLQEFEQKLLEQGQVEEALLLDETTDKLEYLTLYEDKVITQIEHARAEFFNLLDLAEEALLTDHVKDQDGRLRPVEPEKLAKRKDIFKKIKDNALGRLQAFEADMREKYSQKRESIVSEIEGNNQNYQTYLKETQATYDIMVQESTNAFKQYQDTVDSAYLKYKNNQPGQPFTYTEFQAVLDQQNEIYHQATQAITTKFQHNRVSSQAVLKNPTTPEPANADETTKAAEAQAEQAKAEARATLANLLGVDLNNLEDAQKVQFEKQVDDYLNLKDEKDPSKQAEIKNNLVNSVKNHIESLKTSGKITDEVYQHLMNNLDAFIGKAKKDEDGDNTFGKMLMSSFLHSMQLHGLPINLNLDIMGSALQAMAQAAA